MSIVCLANKGNTPGSLKFLSFTFELPNICKAVSVAATSILCIINFSFYPVLMHTAITSASPWGIRNEDTMWTIRQT